MIDEILLFLASSWRSPGPPEQTVSGDFSDAAYGCGSKSNNQGTAYFISYFHLPGLNFGNSFFPAAIYIYIYTVDFSVTSTAIPFQPKRLGNLVGFLRVYCAKK